MMPSFLRKNAIFFKTPNFEVVPIRDITTEISLVLLFVELIPLMVFVD